MSTHWKDLVTKSDTVQDPYEWRYLDTIEIYSVFTANGEELRSEPSVICIHPDLMFNFWHERIW